MTRPAPPIRVRKARYTSKVGCGHLVMVGQQIVRLDGTWHCRDCALLTIKLVMEQPPKPGRAGQDHPTEEGTPP